MKPNGKTTRQTDVNADHDLPIDKGYAWVIVFSAMLCCSFGVGVIRTNGILFVEYLDHFHQPASVTSVVIVVQSVGISITALLSQTVLLSVWSERQVIMTGGLLGGLGFILSAPIPSIYPFMLTQGLLVGISIGMIMGPGIVITNKYFDKWRSMATAVTALGGNLGSIVMPLFTDALIEFFGLRGGLMVLGATYLNVVVFGSLLIPLPHFEKRKRRKRQTQSKYAAVPSTEEHVDKREAAGGQGSLASQILYSSETRVAISNTPLHGSDPEPYSISKGKGFEGDNAEQGIPDEVGPSGDQTDNAASKLSHSEDDTDSTVSCLIRSGNQSDNAASKLRHSSAETDNTASKSSQKLEPPKRQSNARKYLAKFNCASLFGRPQFWIIVISFGAAHVPGTLFGTFLPAMAEVKGITGRKPALLITVFGATSIASKLLFGWMADRNIMPRYLLLSILFAVSSTAGLFTQYYTTFDTLVIFSVIYGLFGLVYYSLFPVVVVELMGLGNLAVVIGFVQLFQGAAVAATQPILGYLRDVTGDYRMPYIMMSAFGYLTSAILLLTPLTRRCEPSQKRDDEEGVAVCTAVVNEPVRESCTHVSGCEDVREVAGVRESPDGSECVTWRESSLQELDIML